MESANLTINFSKIINKIKPMHSVNNGPIRARYELSVGNFDSFKLARIPFVRNHDASHCASYGGEHTVDIHAIFKNFDADENDPANYDFLETDKYTKNILDAGSEVYYRLGSKIEQGLRKFGTIVPKDFNKWARICEHIIRHYNEGWANGFHYNIIYWEIWNEPESDIDTDDKRTWSGTWEQFFEMFDITARHLKKCFPYIKVGGPSSGCNLHTFIPQLLGYLTRDKNDPAPLDFFSWHAYRGVPDRLFDEVHDYIRGILDEYGYTKTESILNEYNYIENWTTKFPHSLQVISSLKGSAYTSAAMLYGQHSTTVDMLMYYDARPKCGFNGMFDNITLKPLKGYFPFRMYSYLYELGKEADSNSDNKELYSVSAIDGDRAAIMMTNYNKEDFVCDTIDTHITIDGIDKNAEFECFVLSEEYSMTPVEPLKFVDGKARLKVEPYSTVLLLKK